MVKVYMSLRLKCYDVRLVIGTRFVCLIVCLVAGYQEGRVQCKTKISKEG